MSAPITNEAIAAVLYAAADLIATGWCQETEAVDALGYACDPLSKKARKWDGSGAILRAAWDLHGETPLHITQASVCASDRWLDIADAAEAEASMWARAWNKNTRGLVDLNDQPGCHAWRIASVLRSAAHRVKEGKVAA